MYGLDGLDEKILRRLSELEVKSRFFIEAGANDGLTQSNTAILEFHHNWKGVLVEPNFINYQRACFNRPRSRVFHGALVSSSYSSEKIRGIFSDDSLNRWNGLCSGVTDDHAKQFPEWLCDVPAITLTKVLQECDAPQDIGLLSLDVEGYELEALRGLNTEIWRPQVIVLEVADWYNKDVMTAHIDFMKGIDYIPDKHFELTVHDFIFIDKRRFT